MIGIELALLEVVELIEVVEKSSGQDGKTDGESFGLTRICCTLLIAGLKLFDFLRSYVSATNLHKKEGSLS